MEANNRHEYNRLIDFHTHILPKMDDGSTSESMSIQMINLSASQGVGCIVLTPHFYPSQDYPEHFLSKRKIRLDALLENRHSLIPVVIPGAEVQYFDGITEMRDLPKLRIGKSAALLIEMPFCKWTKRMADDISELNRRREYRIILAHIERYLRYHNEGLIRRLVGEGVLMQANANFFTGRFTSKKALNMLDNGLIHLLGSDCHNMTSRLPNLGDAFDVIQKKLGYDAVKAINNRGLKLLLTEARDYKTAAKELTETNI